MKNRVALATVMVLSLALMPIQMETTAQTTTAPQLPANIPQLPQVKLPDLTLLKPPDLMIEDLFVNTNRGKKHGDETWYPFNLTVKNIGELAVKEPFFIVFERDFGEQGAWEPDRERSNAFRIDKPVAPGQAIGVSGHIRLKTEQVSQRTVKVRAVADSAVFEEFPPSGGYVQESNEENNVSNEVTIHGSYQPTISGTSTDRVLKGVDEVTVTGTGFGPSDPGRTLLLMKGQLRLPAEIIRWTGSAITFKVPVTAELGYNRVCVGYSDSLNPVSNSQTVIVLGSKDLEWLSLMDAFNYILSALFSIHLHTWTGSYNYENVSFMEVYGKEEPVPLEVPLIEFKTDVGYYRFLVNDLNSIRMNISQGVEPGFRMNRDNCSDNQLRLVIDFESDGQELIGYYKVLGPAGQWRRTGAPDIHVDNSSAEILFKLRNGGSGRLDYEAGALFRGDVNASGPVWDTILDLFQKGWKDDLEKEVGLSVRLGVNEHETRQQISESLTESIRLLLGMEESETISGYNFNPEGIQVLYY